MQEKDFRGFESLSREMNVLWLWVLPSEPDLVTVCDSSQLDLPWMVFLVSSYQALRTVLFTGEMIHKHTHSEAQPWNCSL